MLFCFFILVLLLLFCFIQKNQNEINKINRETIELLYKHAKLQEEKFLQKIKNLENEKIEMEQKFALEIEEFRKTFERITKNHYKKIRNLEKSPPNISETENIF